MEQNILFNERGVIVTQSKLIYNGNNFPFGMIKKVGLFKMPLEIKTGLINLAVAIAGLCGIFTFSVIGLILGVIGVGIGGFNVWNIYGDFKNPEYVVFVELHSGESIHIKQRDIDFARRLSDVLNTALVDA